MGSALIYSVVTIYLGLRPRIKNLLLKLGNYGWFDRFLDKYQQTGINKCPYCLQYWREESQIFMKFGKISGGATRFPFQISSPNIPSITSGEVWWWKILS